MVTGTIIEEEIYKNFQKGETKLQILILGARNPIDNVEIRGIVTELVEKETKTSISFNPESDVVVVEGGLTRKKITVVVLPSSSVESFGKRKEALEALADSLKKELHECRVILARRFPS